jgi:hypothetical protein
LVFSSGEKIYGLNKLLIILSLGEQFAFGIHDGFIQLGGVRGQARDLHEVALARRLQRLLPYGLELALQGADDFRCDSGCGHFFSFPC